jgi:ATP/ADP translocase
MAQLEIGAPVVIVGGKMSHECKLTINLEDSGEEISVSGQFEDDEWTLLEAFVQYAEDLANTKLVQAGVPSSLNLHMGEELRMTVSAQLPAWEDVIVFLHKFRPIGLQSESTYFYKICNLLSRVLTHPFFQGLIKEQRDIYKGKRLQEVYRVRVNDVLLNSEEVLSAWLNSYEYHRDKEKREFIEHLSEVFPLEALKVIFLSLLAQKAQAILDLAMLVQVVLGKQKSIRRGRA